MKSKNWAVMCSKWLKTLVCSSICHLVRPIWCIAGHLRQNVTWRKLLMRKDSSSSTTAVKSVISWNSNLRSQYASNEHLITLDQIKLDKIRLYYWPLLFFSLWRNVSFALNRMKSMYQHTYTVQSRTHPCKKPAVIASFKMHLGSLSKNSVFCMSL